MRLPRRIDKILILITVAVLLLVGGTMVKNFVYRTFAESMGDTYEETDNHFVIFYDDGEKLIVKTDAKTVGEAIKRAGIIINEADLVDPGMGTEINSNNFFINIHRARPVVVKDGHQTKYIMTANYEPKTIAAEAGMTVYDGDTIELVKSDNFLESGVASEYLITRNGGRTLTIETEIEYSETTVKDYNLEAGKSEIRQLGELGKKTTSYNILYKDGVEVSRELVAESVTKEPVERIVAVGAKKSIPPEQEACAGWAREAGVSEEDLSAALDLIYHESGCRIDAVNNYSGAYGIPQALPGSKMATEGSDWETNPVTQIKWMAKYVKERYGGWQQAIDYWWNHHWY